MLDTEFERIGKRLFSEKLVGGNFGNMSVRGDGGYYITLNRAYLDALQTPVFVPHKGNIPPDASSECQVHSEVYRTTAYAALVHAHPPYAIALSIDADFINPVSSEGKMLCREIPVVGGDPGSYELARNVADALEAYPVAIARGHGTFAAGKTLDEAYLLTSAAEHSCMVILLSVLSGRLGRL